MVSHQWPLSAPAPLGEAAEGDELLPAGPVRTGSALLFSQLRGSWGLAPWPSLPPAGKAGLVSWHWMGDEGVGVQRHSLLAKSPEARPVREAALPCLAPQRKLAGVPPVVIIRGPERHTFPTTPFLNLLADLFSPSRPVEHRTLPQGPGDPGESEGNSGSVPDGASLAPHRAWSGLRDRASLVPPAKLLTALPLGGVLDNMFTL